MLGKSSHPEVFLVKVFRKYASNLQENAHVERKATLLKSHFGMGKFAAYFQKPFSKNISERLLLLEGSV